MTRETIRKLRNVAAEAERCGTLINLEPWELNALLDAVEGRETGEADTLPPDTDPDLGGAPV